ncbi:antitoxin [Nocardioides sp. Iso805N]|uniref:antitoxin n=1 Tax=Nocardioides sp. Iso805N TaxID=1283287 RepID=UPI00035CCA24|nr:antitoxin [Nocardioides sp. Iso805N]
MGFLDDALDKAKDVVEDHADQVSGALDKAGEFADDKTDGKYTDKIAGGVEKAKDALDLDD